MNRPFLTDLDSRAAVKGSRDPLGIQSIWGRFGRHVVGNLSTVSNSARDFTLTILGYYFAEQVAAFEDNYVAFVLGCAPEAVTSRFAELVGLDATALRAELQVRSGQFLRPIKKLPRGDRFEAVQAAAIEWLKEIQGTHQELATVVWHQRFESMRLPVAAAEVPDIGGWLECRTFFSELRKRPELRQRLWPEPATGSVLERFREQELRARLLTAAIRLGHSFVDLYVVTIRRLGSLKSWTPSSMEQRIGRIDRVCSQTDRRLTSLRREPAGDDKLAVFFPHLQDTVEVVQVRRVLARMNTFLRLMHEGLLQQAAHYGRLDLGRELLAEPTPVPQIGERLCSAFKVRDEHLQGGRPQLAVTSNTVEEVRTQFDELVHGDLSGLDVIWERSPRPGQLFGTVKLVGRQQPLTLLLRSIGGQVLVRCISPIGRVFRESGAPATTLGLVIAKPSTPFGLRTILRAISRGWRCAPTLG